MLKDQNDVAAKADGTNETALRELELLAAAWIERQRQRLTAARH